MNSVTSQENDDDTIIVPSRATVEESYDILGVCRQIEGRAAARVLDATRTERLGPMGVALLALAITRRRARGLGDLSLRVPRTRGAAQFLREVGFNRFLTAERANDNPAGGTLSMRHLFQLTPAYTEEIGKLVAQRVPGTPEELGYLIEFCLNELLQNVFEHANSREGCFVVTRWYARSENVCIAVVDGGVGIPAALRRKSIAGLHKRSDQDVVIAAVTRKGITSREGAKQGGLGLKLLREAVTERGGKLFALSSTARVVFTPTAARARKSPVFRGTAIELDFRPLATVRAGTPEEVF